MWPAYLSIPLSIPLPIRFASPLIDPRYAHPAHGGGDAASCAQRLCGRAVMPLRRSFRRARLWPLLSLAAAGWAVSTVSTWAGDVRFAAAPDVADSAAAGTTDTWRDYDIPAQPLEAALKRYAVVTDRPTLFPSVMVAGRTSSSVHGRYRPEDVLRRLLDGTGLVAEKIRAGSGEAFILKEMAVSAPTDPAPASAASGKALDFGYGALVQARVRAALCANARTARPDYRALLRFGIDATGRVQQAGLLSSTGNTQRDAALLDALRQVRIDHAPPPGMAQPLTMVVLPEDGGDAAQRCVEARRAEQP